MGQNCYDFVNFGECPRINCSYDHNKKPQNPESFVARIISILQDERGVIEIKNLRKKSSSKYWLEKGWWHNKDAKNKDLVEFQPSITKERHSGKNRGRVLKILSKSPHSISFPVINSAFTLDPPQTKCYDDAISIENCEDKECFQESRKCKKIGIHVAAPDLVKLSLNELNCYASASQTYKKGLVKNQYHLVISVYLHTNSEREAGPKFSIVKVEENFKFIDDESAAYGEHIEVLWPRFRDSMYSKSEYTPSCLYILNWPKAWKELFVIDEAMAAFNRIVSNFIMESSKSNVYFITSQKGGAWNDVSSEKIMVPKSFYKNDHNSSCKDKVIDVDVKIFEFLASGSMSQHVKTTKINPSFPSKFERDVETSSELNKDKLIRSTSPLRDSNHCLNLQVICHTFLTNSTDPLYQKNEVLGILGIRFKQPNICQAFVQKFNKKSFVAKYPRVLEYNLGTCEIEYTMLCEAFVLSEDELTVVLKKIFCDETEYCNGEMVVFNAEEYRELVNELLGEQRPQRIQQYCSSMEKNLKNVQGPYSYSDIGTNIKLQLTSKLQLQISADDEKKKNHLGLRLLRIGTDCHYCFLHMNHPELAFLSDRKDIRCMELGKKIKVMTEKSIDEKLSSTQFAKVDDITWFDEYLSGGSFQTSCKASKGDLLCIRKESNVGDNNGYVWNAHAIISSSSDGKVEFSVCTLSQAEKAPIDKQKIFCVDIISAK